MLAEARPTAAVIVKEIRQLWKEGSINSITAVIVKETRLLWKGGDISPITAVVGRRLGSCGKREAILQ